MYKKLIVILLFLITLFPSPVQGTDDFVIVIDPGHGGVDPGAVYGDCYEKTFNRKIANYIKESLQKYEGVKIYLTSTGDNYLSLGARVDFATYFDADVFISVHNNAGSATATGTTAFTPSGNYKQKEAQEAVRLAGKILEEVHKAAELKNNGTHSRLYLAEEWVFYPDGSLADYYGIVKRCIEAGIPGLIMEYAFMSNPSDLDFLKNDNNLRKCGEATAEAIAKEYGLKLRTQGSYDGSHQPVKPQNDLRLEIDGISAVMTFGDAPFTIPVKGGSGNGKISYEFDTARVFKFDGGKIYIIGADDNVEVMSSKGTDGEYLPATSSNKMKISVKPKTIPISLSASVANDNVIITCNANGLVPGFLPRGKIAFYVNGSLHSRKAFEEGGKCAVVLDNPSGTYSVTAKYESVTTKNYVDFYTIKDASMTYEPGSLTPTPSREPATAKPTEEPAQTRSPVTTAEPSPENSVTPLTTEKLAGTEKEKDDSLLIYMLLLVGFIILLIVVSVMYVTNMQRKKKRKKKIK